LISLVGTHGKISLVPKNIERGIINPRLLKITFNQSKAIPKFMKILLESKIVEVQIIKYVHGMSMGILNTKILRKILFPIPSIEEQEKIVEVFSILDSKITELKQTKSFFKNLKKGLAQKLLSGQIRTKI